MRIKVNYRKELVALTKFSSPQFERSQLFVGFLGCFESEKHSFLAMEYFPLDTLENFMKERMEEEATVKVIALQLVEGLQIMHEEGFSYRDLKPQNIFLVDMPDRPWIKIGDFGISKCLSSDETALQTMADTPSYLAPEVQHYIETDDDGESDSYTNAVDIWSLGRIIYQQFYRGRSIPLPFPSYSANVPLGCRGMSIPSAK